MNQRTVGEKTFDFFNYLFLTFLMCITIYPMLYVAFASFSEPIAIETFRGVLWRPLGFSLQAYNFVFHDPMILKGYLNTIFVVVVGILLNIVLTSFGAYALSRKSLQYRKAITLFIVFTMFFSGGIIPYYLTVKQLGLYNSLWALIIPQAISAFNLIIMKTSFEAIPDSLEESAKIDGANDFVILFRIILPLSMPVVAVMVLYYGVAHWNSWFNAMIFLEDRSLYPLQLILREILIQGSTGALSSDQGASDIATLERALQYATIMVATVPILFIYPFLQKYFVKGALIGAVKG